MKNWPFSYKSEGIKLYDKTSDFKNPEKEVIDSKPNSSRKRKADRRLASWIDAKIEPSRTSSTGPGCSICISTFEELQSEGKQVCHFQIILKGIKPEFKAKNDPMWTCLLFRLSWNINRSFEKMSKMSKEYTIEQVSPDLSWPTRIIRDNKTFLFYFYIPLYCITIHVRPV